MKYTYQVESGIELPPGGSNKGKYPWHEMEVGQSFFVPETHLDSYTNGYRPKGPPKLIKNGWKFVPRDYEIDPIHKCAGVRVFRIA